MGRKERSAQNEHGEWILADVARALNASIVVGRRVDDALLIERVHDRLGLGLEPGTSLPFARFVALVPVRGTTGGHHGEMGAVRDEAGEIPEAERMLIQLAARLLGDVEEQGMLMVENWRQRALHDPLTGLPNRALLRDRLEQALAKAARERLTVAVLLMDLDGFKPINDRLGHAAGDAVLVEIGNRLRATLRESDTVARLGGDEFVIVLPGADEGGAIRVARAILRAVRRPQEQEGEIVSCWASIGIALAPMHGRDPDTLLRHADEAMYTVKRAEGGCSIYAAASRRTVF